MSKLFNWAAVRIVAAFALALPIAAMAATTYSTDHTVTASGTTYTTSAGNANVTWQNFNFRAAVDKDHMAHGYYFYLKDGDTDIGETDSAVKLDSITLTWGSSGTSAGIGLSDTPYLVVTTADDTPVILGVSAAGAPYTYNETSTFVFTDLVLASNAKYRFYFYKNDVSGLSVGATLTGATTGRVNGRYHNTSSDARADYNDIRCNGGTGYSVNCSFVVSPVETTDVTVLETSNSAVTLAGGNSSLPVVIEGKVADGVVEVGSAANVAQVVTVDGEATTLELTDSLTATAFYFPAAVTINASSLSDLDPTGDDVSKTTVLLSGALKYTTAPTVTLPAASAGMIYETNITASGISVTVVKGADCVETITGNTSWSTIKPSGWIDSVVGDKPAITITYAGEEPVTLTFDEAVQAGTLTLTGNIVVEASAAATFGTVSAGAGSVVEMANMTITTQSGSGVYRYRSGYPSTVPNQGLTYEYVGTADPENPGTVNLNGMRGTVKTTGYMSITGYYPLNTAARLDVVSGTTTLSAGVQGICGYITIREGATLKNLVTDSLAYSNSSSIIDIYGTLDMGTSRWTVWSGAAFNLRGGEITGVGESNNGAIDLMGTCNVTAYADSTISANVKFRNALSNITVSDGVTLTISGITKPGYDGGGITKKGAGTLKFTSDPYVPGGITVEAGTLAFDTESDVDPVVTYAASVLNSANMDYVSASNWKGRVVVSAVAAGTTTTQVALNKTGNANSYLTLNGISGDAWCAGSNYTVQPAITLAGDVNFQNGSSKKTVTFRKIATGTGNLSLKSWSGCTGITYGFTTLDADNYTGTIQLDGSVLTFNVGDILKAGAAVGDKVLPLTVANNATVNLSNAKLNGEAAGFELREDGVYYTTAYVTINVPAVANTTVNVVSSSGGVVDNGDGTYKVANGATVTVTYSSDDYEVTGGTFEFTASEGYTVDTTGVTTAQYVASITVGETTSKYSTLQAAVDAVAQNKDIVLLDSVIDGATVSREVTFNVVPGEYTYGDIVAGGDYILTTTALEGKTRYTFAQAVIAVTINEVRTLYTMMTANTGIEAANAGPIGTTIEILSGDPSTYVEYLPMFDLNTDTGIFTKVANPVAAVYDGVLQVQVYRSLAEAIEAATAGQTVTLLADDHVSFSAGNLEIAISKALTIDGAGYTVYGVNDYAGGSGDHDIYISGSGDVTIKNVTLANFAGGVSNNMRTYPIWTGSAYAGTLTLDNVTVQNFNRTAFNLNGGTVVVTNCTITGDTTKEAYFQEGIGVYNANVTIVDTAISNVGSNLDKEDSQIAACIQLGNPNGPAAGTGSITVVNGTYSGDYGIIVASNAQNTVSVQGGTFAGFLMVEEGEGGTIAVSGGTFDAEVPAEYCADGYEPKDNGDGTYTVRVDLGWIYEAADHPNYTGSWSNEVSYSEGKIKIDDGNTYMANRPSDGQFVTVAMTLSFDDANDEDEDVGDAKAAVRLASGETSGTYQFQLYTSDGANKVWTNATVEAITATKEHDYTFVFVLDLTNKVYTATVVDDVTTNVMTVGGATNIPFAYQGDVTPVQKIEFIGSGSVTSIEGSYEDAPAPAEEFVDGEEIGSVTLDTAQAAWLNGQGNYSALADKIATMSQDAFNAAHLLNLNILDENYEDFEEGDFAVTDFRFETEDDVDYVVVEVTLERHGALDGGINGVLKLTGTSQLGVPFTEKATSNFTFIDSDTVTLKYVKDDTTLFYKPVIE